MQKVPVFPVPNCHSTSLGPTRLSLCNCIVTLQHRKNSLLLNHRGFLKTIRINTTKKVHVEIQIIEALYLLIPVRFEINIIVNLRRLSYTRLHTVQTNKITQSIAYRNQTL